MSSSTLCKKERRRPQRTMELWTMKPLSVKASPLAGMSNKAQKRCNNTRRRGILVPQRLFSCRSKATVGRGAPIVIAGFSTIVRVTLHLTEESIFWALFGVS